jgi:sRNA-binding protein
MALTRFCAVVEEANKTLQQAKARIDGRRSKSSARESSASSAELENQTEAQDDFKAEGLAMSGRAIRIPRRPRRSPELIRQFSSPY